MTVAKLSRTHPFRLRRGIRDQHPGRPSFAENICRTASRGGPVAGGFGSGPVAGRRSLCQRRFRCRRRSPPPRVPVAAPAPQPVLSTSPPPVSGANRKSCPCGPSIVRRWSCSGFSTTTARRPSWSQSAPAAWSSAARKATCCIEHDLRDFQPSCGDRAGDGGRSLSLALARLGEHQRHVCPRPPGGAEGRRRDHDRPQPFSFCSGREAGDRRRRRRPSRRCPISAAR